MVLSLYALYLTHAYIQHLKSIVENIHMLHFTLFSSFLQCAQITPLLTHIPLQETVVLEFQLFSKVGLN